MLFLFVIIICNFCYTYNKYFSYLLHYILSYLIYHFLSYLYIFTICLTSIYLLFYYTIYIIISITIYLYGISFSFPFSARPTDFYYSIITIVSISFIYYYLYINTCNHFLFFFLPDAQNFIQKNSLEKSQAEVLINIHMLLIHNLI